MTYVADFLDDGMSLQFAEVAHECYLTSCTDLHEVPCLKKERHIVAERRDDEVGPGLKTEEGDWDFDSLVTIDEMERTGVREKLCDVQDACRAENMSVPTTVVKVTDLVAHVVSVRKQKAALERSNSHVLRDLNILREELDVGKRLVEESDSREHALHNRVAALKEKVLEKVTIGRQATRDTDAAWCKKFVAADGFCAEECPQLEAGLAEMQRCNERHRVQVERVEKALAVRKRQQREAAAAMTSERVTLLDNWRKEKFSSVQECDALLVEGEVWFGKENSLQLK